MDAIQASLNHMMTTFGQRMDAFEERQASNPSTPIADSESLALEFHDFKLFVLASFKALQSQIEAMAKQLDKQEMHSRRKFLLLHGLKELHKENTSQELIKTLSNRLMLSDLTVSDVTQYHRLGSTHSGDKPRPILFKLRDIDIRSKIWSTKTSLKGSGLIISEFLTKPRQELFLAARHKYGVKKSWTSEGNVFVIEQDGRRRRIVCAADLAGSTDCIADLASSSHKESTKRSVATKPPGTAPASKPKRAAASKK